MKLLENLLVGRVVGTISRTTTAHGVIYPIGENSEDTPAVLLFLREKLEPLSCIGENVGSINGVGLPVSTTRLPGEKRDLAPLAVDDGSRIPEKDFMSPGINFGRKKYLRFHSSSERTRRPLASHSDRLYVRSN